MTKVKIMQMLIRKLKNNGWFVLPELIVDQYGQMVGPIGISIYIFLASKADETNYSIADTDVLANKLNLSKRKVEKTLRKLERINLIKIHPNQLCQILWQPPLYFSSCPKSQK